MSECVYRCVCVSVSLGGREGRGGKKGKKKRGREKERERERERRGSDTPFKPSRSVPSIKPPWDTGYLTHPLWGGRAMGSVCGFPSVS